MCVNYCPSLLCAVHNQGSKTETYRVSQGTVAVLYCCFCPFSARIVLCAQKLGLIPKKQIKRVWKRLIALFSQKLYSKCDYIFRFIVFWRWMHIYTKEEWQKRQLYNLNNSLLTSVRPTSLSSTVASPVRVQGNWGRKKTLLVISDPYCWDKKPALSDAAHAAQLG